MDEATHTADGSTTVRHRVGPYGTAVRDTGRQADRLDWLWLYSFASRTVVVVSVKRIVGFILIALVIFFVIEQTTVASQSVENIGAMLSNAATSVTTFFTNLVS